LALDISSLRGLVTWYVTVNRHNTVLFRPGMYPVKAENDLLLSDFYYVPQHRHVYTTIHVTWEEHHLYLIRVNVDTVSVEEMLSYSFILVVVSSSRLLSHDMLYSVSAMHSPLEVLITINVANIPHRPSVSAP
jgi:hypothetical protein